MAAKLISTEEAGALFDKLGVPWPAASEDADGTAFVALEQIEIFPQWEEISWLGPRYPDRKVATAWSVDEYGDEYACAWRELTDEEWDAAIASYENGMAEFHRTHGRHRRKTGPDIIEATFLTAAGARARGRTQRGASGWCWLEVSWQRT